MKEGVFKVDKLQKLFFIMIITNTDDYDKIIKV